MGQVPLEVVYAQLRLVQGLLRDVRERQRAGVGSGPRDDLCDLDVLRLLVAQFERDRTVAELARLGDALRLLGDEMHAAGSEMRSVSPGDELQWSYTALFARSLALVISERVAGLVGWDPAPELPAFAELFHVSDDGRDLLACSVTSDATDRLLDGVQRAMEMCASRTAEI